MNPFTITYIDRLLEKASTKGHSVIIEAAGVKGMQAFTALATSFLEELTSRLDAAAAETAAAKGDKAKEREIAGRYFSEINDDLMGRYGEMTFSDMIDDDTGEVLARLSDLQKEFRKYFRDKLAEHDATSPADLNTEQKKRAFFESVKKGWVKGKGPRG